MFGIKKFHQYLYGLPFTLMADHKPPESLFNEKKPIPTMAAARIQRWALTLAAYTVEYKPRAEHSNADAPSRLPLPIAPHITPVPTENVWTMELLNATPVGLKEIQNGPRSDIVLLPVVQCVQQGWPSKSADEALQPYFSRKVELSIQDGCLLWESRVVIRPPPPPAS